MAAASQLCPEDLAGFGWPSTQVRVRCPGGLAGTSVDSSVCFSREFALGLAEIRGFWREHQAEGDPSHYQLGLWFWAWVLCQGGFMVTPHNFHPWQLIRIWRSLQVGLHLGPSARQRSEARSESAFLVQLFPGKVIQILCGFGFFHF